MIYGIIIFENAQKGLNILIKTIEYSGFSKPHRHIENIEFYL